MEFEMMEEPERSTEESIQELLEELISTDRLVPNTMVLDGEPVSILDIRPNIIAFREQKSLLQRFGRPWPSVRLHGDTGDGEKAYWVPLDLSNSMPDAKLLERAIRDGAILLKSQKEAQQAGFITKQSQQDEMDESFIDILGKIILRRSTSTDVPNIDPPTDEFTVTTNSHGVQVLYATGYFVSTRQGFGISTPASRALPWGNYIFGYKKNNNVRFDDTLWTVPDVTNIHIEV